MLEGTCHCGALTWTFDGEPESATACSCTLCRRYGALWAYDYENERIKLSGQSTVYTRKEKAKPALEIHFCPTCGSVACWRGLGLTDDGRRRIAVNLRLAEPHAVAHIVIDHFDGLDTFDDLPRDGKCIADMWF
ncbi:GFA family protein [Hyphomicrobium sp.]|uniref:GFA family protein n=1 Tax=Hyphomicrobium sp. TaxID=82 RepID=UPI0025C4AAEF|nr:GFA family protein [Hyphomicrobium sp.]MCC7253141.1 GFA family protein [Hyphomicrobium sp.]